MKGAKYFVCLVLCLLFAGCSAPKARVYLLTPNGGGVWYMPKGAKAPVTGYLMDERGALYLLEKAGESRKPENRSRIPTVGRYLFGWPVNTVGIARATHAVKVDGRVFLVSEGK